LHPCAANAASITSQIPIIGVRRVCVVNDARLLARGLNSGTKKLVKIRSFMEL
jgi:hypothetical protein